MKNTLINESDARLTKKVYIEWIDSMAIQGWNHESRMSDEYAEPSKIVSIGFLIKSTDKFVVISTSVSVNASCMDPLSIPKCAITKMKNLKI